MLQILWDFANNENFPTPPFLNTQMVPRLPNKKKLFSLLKRLKFKKIDRLINLYI